MLLVSSFRFYVLSNINNQINKIFVINFYLLIFSSLIFDLINKNGSPIFFVFSDFHDLFIQEAANSSKFSNMKLFSF